MRQRCPQACCHSGSRWARGAGWLPRRDAVAMAMGVFSSIISGYPGLAQAGPIPHVPCPPAAWHTDRLSAGPSLPGPSQAAAPAPPVPSAGWHTRGRLRRGGTQAPWGTAAVGRGTRPPPLVPPRPAGAGHRRCWGGQGRGARCWVVPGTPWVPVRVVPTAKHSQCHRSHPRGVMGAEVRSGSVLCHGRGPHPCWPGWEAEQCHVPGGHSRVGTAGWAQLSPPTSQPASGAQGSAVVGRGLRGAGCCHAGHAWEPQPRRSRVGASRELAERRARGCGCGWSPGDPPARSGR